MECIGDKSGLSGQLMNFNTSEIPYLASLGVPCSKQSIESSIGIKPSFVPLISSNLLEGISSIPVSRRENFAFDPSLKASMLL